MEDRAGRGVKTPVPSPSSAVTIPTLKRLQRRIEALGYEVTVTEKAACALLLAAGRVWDAEAVLRHAAPICSSG